MFVPSMTSNIEKETQSTLWWHLHLSACKVRVGFVPFFKSKSARDHFRHLVESRMIKSMFSVHNFSFIKKNELIVLITMNTNTWVASGLSNHQHTNFICLRTFFCVDDLFSVFLLLYLLLPHGRMQNAAQRECSTHTHHSTKLKNKNKRRKK